jgi:hypothetical protein
MKHPTSWMVYVVYAVPVLFITLVSTVWNWNDTTVKELLGVIAWLCLTLNCLVALIGSDVLKAIARLGEEIPRP